MFLFYMFEHLEITFKHNCLYFHMKIGLFHLFTLGITRKLFKKRRKKKQHKRTPKSRCVINILYLNACMHLLFTRRFFRFSEIFKAKAKNWVGKNLRSLRRFRTSPISFDSSLISHIVRIVILAFCAFHMHIEL